MAEQNGRRGRDAQNATSSRRIFMAATIYVVKRLQANFCAVSVKFCGEAPPAESLRNHSRPHCVVVDFINDDESTGGAVVPIRVDE